MKYEKKRSLLKNIFMKLNYLLAVLLLPGFVGAQAPEKNKEVEQIVITKKGGTSDKLNIIVDGEDITVNGARIDKNDKNADITVIHRRIKDLNRWVDETNPGQKRIIRNYTLRPQDLPTGNKAMLGVLTTKTDNGVKVMSVTHGSAAAIAGLTDGDIITEVDKTKIETPDDLSAVIKDKNPGDKITISYLRNNKQQSTVAELKKWAPDLQPLGDFNSQSIPGFDIEEFREGLGNANRPRNFRNFQFFDVPLNRPKLGIKIQDLDKGTGVKVVEVEEGSDAAKAGLKAGDIIKKVDGKEIEGTEDMRDKVFGKKPGDNIPVSLNRNGKIQNLNIQISKKIKTADL